MHEEHADRADAEDALSVARARADEAELLARVATVVAGELEYSRMVEAILDQTVSLLGAAVAHVCSVTEDGEELCLEGARNVPEEFRAPLNRFAVHEAFLASRAAETRELQIVGDLDELDPSLDLARAILQRTGCHTIVAVPLVASSRLLGVLTFMNRASHAFGPSDARVLRTFGDVVATGLAKSKTYERERHARLQLEAVREATLAMSRSRDAAEVLQCIADEARHVAGARFAALAVCPPDGLGQEFDAWVTSGMTVEQIAALRRPPRQVGMLAALAREGRTIRSDDITRDPRFVGFPPEHPPIHSLLGVAIQRGSLSIGSLLVAEKVGERGFSDEDAHALELLAQHAGIAIDEARAREVAVRDDETRARAERELARSELRYRTIVEAARDGIWEIDEETRTTFVNPSMAAMVGHAPEEMLGRRVEEFLDPSSREQVRQQMQRHREGHIETHEVRLRRGDGAPVLALVSATPRFDEAGRYVGALAVLTDVTERHRARMEREKHRESLAFAQRVAQLGSWDWDIASGELTWSDETYRILGRTRTAAAATFDDVLAMIHPADRPRLRAAIDRALAGAEPVAIDVRLQRPDRSERVVHARGDVVSHESGHPLRMVGTVQDVTDRRRGEAATARLAAVVSASGDAIIGLDVDGTINEWNPGAERLYGWSADEIVGRPVAVLAARRTDDDDDTARLLSRVRQGETIVGYETIRRRRDGSVVDVELTMSPIRDANGTIVGVSKVARDITSRKHAEAALRQSEERLRELLEHAADGIFHATPDGRVLDVNEAGAQMLGRTREQIAGRMAHELVSNDDQARLTDMIADLRAGRSGRYELTLVRGDGTTLLAEISAKLLPDGRLQGLTRDVTARRRAEEALRAAEERLRLTIDEAPIGMAIMTLDGRFVRVNKALCEMVRYGAEELQQMRFQDITHPDDLGQDLHLAGKLLRGEIARYELLKRYVRSDRTVVEAFLHGSVVRDPQGAPLHFITQIVDVTERRRAERERERLLAALEQEREWLSAVIERSPMGIVLFEGEDHPRVRANRRAEELLGVDVAERAQGLLDRRTTGTPLLTPSRPAAQMTRRPDPPAARALRGEMVVREAFTVSNERGTPVEISAAPIRGPERRILGAVMIIEDVTAQHELERLREEWVSVIAHDLRQPVTSISAHAQILARRAGEGPIRTGAEHVVASARRLDRMVGDLLDMSRLEARRLDLELRPVALERLVSDVLERMTGQLGDRPVRVTVTRPLPRVLTDALRFEQVLGNLISNAVKYGDAGTEIVIDLAPHEATVRVSVLNQGPGIPRAELATVFDRFKRTRGARRRGISGIGLGLYIARGLVEANGGRMWAESDPGATTAFRFELPVAEGAEAERDQSRDLVQ